MALTLCRGCQSEVPAHAGACPHCGAPNPMGVEPASPSKSTFRKPAVLPPQRFGSGSPPTPLLTPQAQQTQETVVRGRLLWGGGVTATVLVLLVLARTITMWIVLGPLGLLCLGAMGVGVLRTLQNQGLPSFPKTRRVHSLLLALGAPLFFMVAIAIVPKTSQEQRQFEEFQRLEAQRQADKEHRLQAQVACQVYVSERLKAPSSAEFSPSATIVPRDEGGYLIRGLVDAQNAFGAKLRRNYLCAIDPAGQVMSGTVVE